MADQAVDNNQNAHLADPINNIDDHSVGNNINMVSPEQNYRDVLTASSSFRSQLCDDDYHPPKNYKPNAFQEVPVPADANATTRALFVAINQTNYMIFSQGEWLRMLEQTRRAPRRHRRPDTPPPR